jgi:hypothetical protein
MAEVLQRTICQLVTAAFMYSVSVQFGQNINVKGVS